jgi:hypothetical protein
MRVIGRLAPLMAAPFGSIAMAEDVPAPPIKTNPAPQQIAGQSLTDFFSAKTPYEFWLTCIILVAGLLFSALAVFFLRRVQPQLLDSAMRAMTILFVIIATMVLITAGYNNEQIAPAFGLFGTIVGYILGRGDKASQKPPEPEILVEDEPAPSPVQPAGKAPPQPAAPAPSPKTEKGVT